MKKIFVVSDIHGHYAELIEALNAAGFDSKNKQHLLIFCGDLFDRGRENLKVLQFFEQTENRVMIRGNHEDVFLKVLAEKKLNEHCFKNGVLVTIAEFFGETAVDTANNTVDLSGKSDRVDRIAALLMQMRDYYETEKYIFVHGWLPNHSGSVIKEWRSGLDEDWKNARITKWTDMYSGKEAIKGKTVVCGHFPVYYAKRFDRRRENMETTPFFGKGVIAIDGGTDVTGKVNVVVLEDELLSL